jgi:TrmH family RNA methyltransferase
MLAAVDVPSYVISDRLMGTVSATQTAPGILAVVRMPSPALPESPSLILILDAIADPRNLGTMTLAASAAGVEALLLGPGCVDPYSPKVVRAGMGAHLRLPIHQLDWPAIAQFGAGLDIWNAAADAAIDYVDVDWVAPSALIIGSEATGTGQEARELAGGSIAIPMSRGTESLNAAVAASIILFEAARQRRLAT